jgi:hypothetical protein
MLAALWFHRTASCSCGPMIAALRFELFCGLLCGPIAASCSVVRAVLRSDRTSGGPISHLVVHNSSAQLAVLWSDCGSVLWPIALCGSVAAVCSWVRSHNKQLPGRVKVVKIGSEKILTSNMGCWTLEIAKVFTTNITLEIVEWQKLFFLEFHDQFYICRNTHKERTLVRRSLSKASLSMVPLTVELCCWDCVRRTTLKVEHLLAFSATMLSMNWSDDVFCSI